jgi:hypothetical protein
MPLDLAEIHAQAQRNRIDFLKTDLELCFTFADLLDTELQMGDRDAAQRLRENAEHGHDTVAYLLLGVDEGSEKDVIQQRLNQLRARLDGFAFPRPRRDACDGPGCL